VRFRYGRKFGGRGDHGKIVAPQRIVELFEFKGMPGHVSLEALPLTEHSGDLQPPFPYSHTP